MGDCMHTANASQSPTGWAPTKATKQFAVGVFVGAHPCGRLHAHRQGTPIAHGVGSHKGNKAIAHGVGSHKGNKAIAHRVGSYKDTRHRAATRHKPSRSDWTKDIAQRQTKKGPLVAALFGF